MSHCQWVHWEQSWRLGWDLVHNIFPFFYQFEINVLFREESSQFGATTTQVKIDQNRQKALFGFLLYLLEWYGWSKVYEWTLDSFDIKRKASKTKEFFAFCFFIWMYLSLSKQASNDLRGQQRQLFGGHWRTFLLWSSTVKWFFWWFLRVEIWSNYLASGDLGGQSGGWWTNWYCSFLLLDEAQKVS